MHPPDDHLDNVASLGDPARRAVYRFAVATAGGVDRNQVAAGLDLKRNLAAYHLDRLVDDGLLVTHFEHRGTRRGPGSGRPSKVYARSPVEFDVSLPPREYSLAAEILASALERLEPEDALAALQAAAAQQGEQLRADTTIADEADADLDAVVERVERCGYEPYRSDGSLRLRNCPFDALTDHHRDLVCHMNLAFLRGLLHADDDAPLVVELDPAPGECCVTITPRSD